MALRVDDSTPQFYVRDAANSAAISVRESGALVAPTSGTWRLVNTAGTVLAGGAVTVASSVATYAIGVGDWAGTESYGGGYVEQWSLAFAAHDDRSFDRLVYVVPHLPYWPVSDRDLQRLHSDLLSEAPSTDTGWEDKLELAQRMTLARLVATGNSPHEVANWDAFFPFGLALTEYLIAKDLATEEAGQGKWSALATDAGQRAEIEWSRLGYAVDADSDRVPDTTGNLQGSGKGTYLGLPSMPHGRGW